MHSNRGGLAIILALLLVTVGVFAQGVVGFATAIDGSPHTTEEHPIYLVRETLEVTSDWTMATWAEGPLVVATRSRIVDGADAPELRYATRGLTIWVAKQPFDTTKVVVEVEALALESAANALLRVEKFTIGATRVKVAAYDQGQDLFSSIAEFLHDGPAGGPRDFQLDLSPMYALPSASAGVEPAAPELEKKVFAFYYPWYGSPRGPSRTWVHWEGTFTNPSGEEQIGMSTHSPLLGAYDSADERVISAHMAMAKQAGIDGFIASWWGPFTFEDLRMTALLAVADRTGMAISIYYESVRELSQETIVGELSYVVQTYANHPAFLKDSGRPVLFVNCVPCGEWRDPSFWLEVRRAVEARVGPLVLLGDGMDWWDASKYSHAFDGLHAYIYLENNPDQFYAEALETFKVGLSPATDVDAAFSAAYAGGAIPVDRKLVSLTVNPGFHAWSESSPFRDREDGARYGGQWLVAIDLGFPSVLITSWNEWHEGTEIEPSREYGFEYLRMTRQFVQIYKQTGLPALDAGFVVAPQGFSVDSNKAGSGVIAIASSGKTPLVILSLEVRGIEGAFDLGLRGDFYSYAGKEEPSFMAVVVPSVNAGEELKVLVEFRAESAAPVLEIHGAAYDPLGSRLGLSVRLVVADVAALLDQQRALETLIGDLEAELARLEAQLATLEAELANLTKGAAATASQIRDLIEQILVWQVVATAAASSVVVASLLLLRKKKMLRRGTRDSGSSPPENR